MRATTVAFGRRLDIVQVAGASLSDFAADVASAWCRSPKRRIPPKYFYDAAGAELFEAITQLPDYYLTRAETEIITINARKIVAAFGAPLSLVELGNGSTLKTRLLIDAVLRAQNTLHFSAIDVSRETLIASADELVATFPRLFMHALIGDYFDVLESGATEIDGRVKALALCLGSNIGNYDARDAQRLIAAMATYLRPGDGVLVGVDKKKDRDTLERAYDDDGGVMRQFLMNLLTRMNRELGADFRHDNFDLAIVGDEQGGRVDSFLRPRRTHDVTLLDGTFTIHFENAELVPMESSFKYDPNDVARLAYRTGFKITNVWHDEAAKFASYLLVRRFDPSGNVIDLEARHLKIKPK